MPLSRESIEGNFPPDRDEVLTTEQLAERLQVDVITIRRWAAAGKLPAGRLPNREYRFFWPKVFASIFPSKNDSTTAGPSNGGDI